MFNDRCRPRFDEACLSDPVICGKGEGGGGR